MVPFGTIPNKSLVRLRDYQKESEILQKSQ